MRLERTVACAGLALVLAVAAGAEGAERSQGAASQDANAISKAIADSWTGAKRNLQQSAELMAEPDYAFRPTEQVRTFGQILAHVAGANYVFCSAARAEKTPFEEDHFEKNAKSKADIVKALNDSIAYCDAAYTALTDKTAGEGVATPFGMGSRPRAAVLMSNTGHVNEHYGNLVTYFRIKGIVPPSSRRQ